MKVAAIQMPTVKDKMQNIRTVGAYIEKIKADNPDFVILPEMFCCPYQTENFPVYAEKEGGTLSVLLSVPPLEFTCFPGRSCPAADPSAPSGSPPAPP